MKIDQLLFLVLCIFILKVYSLETTELDGKDFKIEEDASKRIQKTHDLHNTKPLFEEPQNKVNIPVQRKCPEYHSCINKLDELSDIILKLKIERASIFETMKMIIRTSKEKEVYKITLEKEDHILSEKFNKLNNLIKPNEVKIARNVVKIDEKNKEIDDMTEKINSWRTKCQNKIAGLQLVNSTFGSYYFYDDRTKQKNWFEAQEICNSYGMNLLTLESQEEYDFVKTELESRIGTNVGYAMTSYWIGLNSLAQDRKLIYESNGYGPESTYNAWLDMEPWTESGFYRCVDWHKSADGTQFGWSLEYCLDKFGFICKTSHLCHSIQMFDFKYDDIK